MKKNYISEIDRFLREFDQKHPPTASQKVEINKHQSISRKRDQKMTTVPQSHGAFSLENGVDLWENF